MLFVGYCLQNNCPLHPQQITPFVDDKFHQKPPTLVTHCCHGYFFLHPSLNFVSLFIFLFHPHSCPHLQILQDDSAFIYLKCRVASLSRELELRQTPATTLNEGITFHLSISSSHPYSHFHFHHPHPHAAIHPLFHPLHMLILILRLTLSLSLILILTYTYTRTELAFHLRWAIKVKHYPVEWRVYRVTWCESCEASCEGHLCLGWRV